MAVPSEATLVLFGTNNESVPLVDRNTEVSVSGTGFPPMAAVTLSLALGSFPSSHAVQADAEGAFGWGQAVVPPLTLNLIISANAIYSEDPTDPDAAVLTVEGRAKVTKLSDGDAHPP